MLKEWIKDIRGYIDRGKFFRQFSLLIWNLFIVQFIYSLGGEELGRINMLASFEHYFIRVHENLVQHSSNNILIA